ncbi:triose-phosphate isomerase [Reichenbachiella sp. MALMAid0571]|uniref:triose-phosphate isomerase n=1 Tax=Reichenbachiella sp. MALMAid0571 TaxID=3143939 RepID=UPI0032E00ADB
MRKNIVAGNWKMNKSLSEGIELTNEIVSAGNLDENVQVVLGTPFIHLTSVSKLVANSSNIEVSAQNCSDKTSGAYTGEISAEMVKSTGAEYVIIGHSERREYFKESNEELAEKLNQALANDLTPIFCCGEPLEIREKGTHFEYVCNQLTESLFHLSKDEFSKIVIAYEPIWAIGTGKTATSQQAQEMHAYLRTHLAEKFGKEAAADLSILYGGSCKPDNAQEIFACPDVDGGLIGGASLKSADFIAIVNSF